MLKPEESLLHASQARGEEDDRSDFDISMEAEFPDVISAIHSKRGMRRLTESTASSVKITMTNRDEKVTEGTAWVQILSNGDRKRRANMFFWKCAFGGFVALIIPPHVLYPLAGLIVGFVGSKLIRKQKYVVLEGRVVCTDCQSEQTLPKTTDQFPYLHFCSNCSVRTEINCPEMAES